MIEKIKDMLDFGSPLRVYLRSDNLVIHDYRPTWVMALCLPGGLGMAGLGIWLAVAFGTAAMFGIVICGYSRSGSFSLRSNSQFSRRIISTRRPTAIASCAGLFTGRK